MIADSLNGTYRISYDHRDLIVQLYYKRNVVENGRRYLRTFTEFYKYYDAGNRIKKVVMKYTGTNQDPVINDEHDAPPGWNYELIQHYVRDVTGNELAVYNDTTVTFWNVYGIDNAGRINYSDGSWNFYLKDHLGSVRCVIDGNGDIISAEDLDMWGYRMTDRSFQSDTTFYKYTGKERDVTTGYDYFGARYYDSRIGRWGGVEPLLDKYVSWSPYVYGLNNPILLIDIDGMDVDIMFNRSTRQLTLIDLDHYQAGLLTVRVSAQDYVHGGIRDESGKLIQNQVLVMEDVFSGGKATDGVVERDPNDPKQKAIPKGVYDILDDPHNTEKWGETWYRLDAKDGNTIDDIHGPTARSGFRWHLGTLSRGCVTCDVSQRDRKEEWNVVKKIMNTTSKSTVKERRGNQRFNPFSWRTHYGRMIVTGEDNIPEKK